MLNIKIDNKDNKMANRFLTAKVTRKVKFMNEDIDIRKLTVANVMEIQNMSKEGAEDETTNLNILLTVIRNGAEELGDLSNEEFSSFPMDELSKLSSEIMKFSGLSNDKQTK